MRKEPGPNIFNSTGALAAEKKGAGDFMEAIKVLAALVLAFAMATVILLILAPEVGLPMITVFITVIPAMIMAISVLALLFLAIYLYESRLKLRYGGQLEELSDRLQQLSSLSSESRWGSSLLLFFCHNNITSHVPQS